MKTTLDIPNALYRKAKIKAATEGRKLKDLVADGLTLVVESTTPVTAAKEAPSAYETLKDARGCVDSGVSDLASNPKHMKGFGRE
jgi:hypothetical protein